MQVVPFNRPPKKEWVNGAEKKKRLTIDLTRDEDDDIEDENFNDYEVSSESSESSEEEIFDMQAYIADLLPGEVIDGMKPTKKANTAHLEDLRYKPKPVDRLKYIKFIYRFIQRKRAQERERRKHYIIKEWEQKIKEYDAKLRQDVEDKMEAHRKEVLIELHRAEQRRIRNSRKVKPNVKWNLVGLLIC
jgi:hypothetical protein